jgi:hypothetical protein
VKVRNFGVMCSIFEIVGVRRLFKTLFEVQHVQNKLFEPITKEKPSCSLVYLMIVHQLDDSLYGTD